jgi:hypothetical protein
LNAQEVRYAKQGDLQYVVGASVSDCTCGSNCGCMNGGVCTNPSGCPVHGSLRQVAPYRAADGRSYRTVNGVTQVYTQTCNGNSCTGSWQNLSYGNGRRAYTSQGFQGSGPLQRLRPRNWLKGRSGRSAGACASCGS